MADTMWRTVLVEPGRFVREETEIPTPGSGQVLIRVTHIGVCGSDISAFYGKHPYIRCPIVLGHEFAGIVAAQGPDGQGPAVDTPVTVIPHLVCGECPACQRARYNLCQELRCIGAQADGAHAQYVVVPAQMAMPIPVSMSLEDAALVEPAAVAYHGINRAGILPSDRVLIVGAGPIGSFAMESAKVLGAQAVYVTDLDPKRVALAASLGADGVIDLSAESLGAGLTRLTAGPHGIDVFADCVGGRGMVLDQLIEMAPRGSRIVVLGVLGNAYDMPHLPDFVEHELTLFGTTMYVPEDYREVINHLAAGRIRTAGMVTHRFTVEQVPEAFAMIDARREPFFKIVFSDLKE